MEDYDHSIDAVRKLKIMIALLARWDNGRSWSQYWPGEKMKANDLCVDTVKQLGIVITMLSSGKMEDDDHSDAKAKANASTLFFLSRIHRRQQIV